MKNEKNHLSGKNPSGGMILLEMHISGDVMKSRTGCSGFASMGMLSVESRTMKKQ